MHYHKWGGIYRLTWQIIAAKSRGYSITVNSTCAACTQLCDVAIAIGLPPTINKVMFNTYKMYSKDFIGYKTWWRDAFERKVMTFNHFNSALVNLSSHRKATASRDLVYGSWYDAQAYCAERNSTLLTLEPSQPRYSIILEHSIGHGWKNSNEHYFAGLYRTGLVSTK